jgi:hypothetical protein
MKGSNGNSDRSEHSPVGVLGRDKVIEPDRALGFAMEISYQLPELAEPV